MARPALARSRAAVEPVVHLVEGVDEFRWSVPQEGLVNRLLVERERPCSHGTKFALELKVELSERRR